MRYHRALARIQEVVSATSYLTPTGALPPERAAALEPVVRGLAAGADPQELIGRVHALHEGGVLDRVQMLSALGVIAASPAVADYAEAMRLAGQQELCAWEVGGANLEVRLASVDRHRGVVAFLLGRYPSALEYFVRALERERSAENLGNVLATLLRLGDLDEARALRDQVRDAFPEPTWAELAVLIAKDADLAPLR